MHDKFYDKWLTKGFSPVEIQNSIVTCVCFSTKKKNEFSEPSVNAMNNETKLYEHKIRLFTTFFYFNASGYWFKNKEFWHLHITFEKIFFFERNKTGHNSKTHAHLTLIQIYFIVIITAVWMVVHCAYVLWCLLFLFCHLFTWYGWSLWFHSKRLPTN